MNMDVLKPGQTGKGILIEQDAGFISPTETRNANLIRESDKMLDHSKPFEFYAVLQKYNTPNRNGRIYPEKILKREAENYKKMINKDMIIRISQNVDDLRRKLYIESKSQDEVVDLARNKEALYSAIPAIRPLRGDEISHLASGYGIRIHPVYKVRKMHTGIDFSSQVGTPIYATADGTVDKVEFSFSGYGKMVEIEHGFGYRTRYAHMHGFAVRKGQHIKRGELIGYVGNTGLSTGPHLHYEVHVQGKQVNPVYYFFSDLNAEEYEKILKLASIENMSLGGTR